MNESEDLSCVVPVFELVVSKFVEVRMLFDDSVLRRLLDLKVLDSRLLLFPSLEFISNTVSLDTTFDSIGLDTVLLLWNLLETV